ncbi:MAG: hypothetical protein Q9169_003769 [Polycauliona sp. 2 TL-2023]
MAGIIAVYSLVIAVLIASAMSPDKKYSLFKYVEPKTPPNARYNTAQSLSSSTDARSPPARPPAPTSTISACILELAKAPSPSDQSCSTACPQLRWRLDQACLLRVIPRSSRQSLVGSLPQGAMP